MKTAILLCALFLASCQTVRRASINGQDIYEVTCNGTARTYMDCMSKASETCAQQSKKMIPLDKDGNVVLAGSYQSFGTYLHRSMSFKCE